MGRKLIEGADYFVRLVDFPDGCGSGGMLIENDDGTYSVYIDAKAGFHAKEKAMRHEYNHMAEDDMHGEKDIRDIERV